MIDTNKLQTYSYIRIYTKKTVTGVIYYFKYK